MKRILILASIIVIVSCQNKTSKTIQTETINITTDYDNTNSLILNDTILYLSDSNDLAQIKLTLLPQGRFDFFMDIYPDISENEDIERDIITSSGTWSGTNKTVILKFPKNQKDIIHLNELFDANYKEGNEFNVIDEYNVEIDFTLQKLNIWGISCYKSQK